MIDIATCASEEIIDADDNRSVGQQPFAEMRAKKAGTAGDKHAFLEMHAT